MTWLDEKGCGLSCLPLTDFQDNWQNLSYRLTVERRRRMSPVYHDIIAWPSVRVRVRVRVSRARAGPMRMITIIFHLQGQIEQRIKVKPKRAISEAYTTITGSHRMTTFPTFFSPSLFILQRRPVRSCWRWKNCMNWSKMGGKSFVRAYACFRVASYTIRRQLTLLRYYSFTSSVIVYRA